MSTQQSTPPSLSGSATARGRRAFALASLACAALGLGACTGSSSSSSDFQVKLTQHASAASTPPIVMGNWVIYFADEATSGAGGTFLNADGDKLDPVAVAVNTSTQQETTLGVAGETAAALANEVWVVVDEARDEVDWDGDLAEDDLVLLHWSAAAGLPMTYVDTLDPDSEPAPLLTSEDRLYYSSTAALVNADDCGLRYVTTAAPTTPVVVTSAGEGQYEPILLAEHDGLLFLLLDEGDQGADLNGDADTTDEYVLALLDGTEPTAQIRSVGLALDDAGDPVAARATAVGDWLVAFLVSEAAQQQSLNDADDFSPNWQPEACTTDDTDQLDQVLHFLHYETWAAATSTPVNTGLAGGDRVLIAGDFVATLSLETDANCDLNDDGDTLDLVARWVEADPLVILPPGAISQMIAVEDVPGGSEGIAVLSSRLVIVASESNNSGADYDGDPDDHDLAAWLDPSEGGAAAWEFQHSTGITGEPFVGVSWMAPEEQQSRLGVAFQEVVPNVSLNNNVDCNLVVKDADVTDSLPTWARFTGSGGSLQLLFPGVGYALATNNAGIQLLEGNAFFRVSEANDDLNYNTGGGDETDFILFRNPLSSCKPVGMATVSSTSAPVVYSDGFASAALFSSEADAETDFNEDGDETDLVVRYFRF